MLSFKSLDTTATMFVRRAVKRSRTVRRIVSSVLVMVSVAAIPASVFAQPPDPDRAAVSIRSAVATLRPAGVGPVLRLAAAGEGVWEAGPPPRRAASRDSVRNGAVIGTAIGAAAFGAFGATLCHVYRERGGPSCLPDALRFAAIGGAIGLGAGIAIDVARSSGPMVRVTVTF